MNFQPDNVPSVTLHNYKLNIVDIIGARNGSQNHRFSLLAFVGKRTLCPYLTGNGRRLDNWTVLSYVLVNLRASDVFISKV